MRRRTGLTALFWRYLLVTGGGGGGLAGLRLALFPILRCPPPPAFLPLGGLVGVTKKTTTQLRCAVQ